MYHSIGTCSARPFRRFVLDPVLFAQQMDALSRWRYTPITVERLVQAMTGKAALPDRPVVLTFDDGFADFHSTALPELRRHAFAATLYVSTAFVGGKARWLRRAGEADRPMLTWSQLDEIAAAGVECGAHGHTHAPLDVLSREAACIEIGYSKRLLEERLQRSITAFAYPFGYHDATVRRAVRQAGYSSACAVKYTSCSTVNELFALPRLLVAAGTDADGLRTLLAGGPRLRAALDPLQRPAWRMVRRTATRLMRQRQAEMVV